MIKLPSNIDLLSLNKLYRYERTAEIHLDWSEVNSIETEAIAMYLCLISFWKYKKLTIIHKAHVSNACFQRISAIQQINSHKGSLSDEFYIVPVEKEEQTMAIKEDIKLFLKHYLSEKNLQKDTSVIELLFSELFMNVCQHSFDTHGFIFIPKIENNCFCMVCADLGIGIVEKIKQGFPHLVFISDYEAIEYATRDFVTTQSTEQNRGRGLNALITAIEVLNGKLTIFSGGGQYVIPAYNAAYTPLEYKHQGTLVYVGFDLTNLHEKEENEILDFEF